MTHLITSPTVFERFLSKIDMSGGVGACWPWTAGRNGDGYGRFSVPQPGGGRRYVAATRVMIAALQGSEVPQTLVVRHTCDNPPCVNPAHLLVGTHLDNAHDMVERDRQARGEQHPKTSITETDVKDIRRRALNGESYSAIGRDLGLNVNTVLGIAKGRTWKHVSGEIVIASRRLDPADVAEARRRVLAGESIRQVAHDLGICYPSLVTAVRGRHPRWDVDIEGVPPVPPRGGRSPHV